MKETVTIIKGDVFIIPNPLIHKGNFPGTEEEKERGLSDLMRTIHWDVILPSSDAYVQVCCATPGKKGPDWHCKKEMETIEGKHEFFPEFLPCTLFKGRKEGDRVYVETRRWGLVELTLNQLGHWQHDVGPFENILSLLAKNAGIEL